jgi:hypothetical protein
MMAHLVEVRDDPARFYYVDARRALVLASVTDNRNPDSIFDPDGGRWTIYCEQHGGLVNVATLADAQFLARHTEGFCDVCSGVDPFAYDGWVITGAQYAENS